MCSALVSNACEDSATYTSLAQPARSGNVAGRRRAISVLTASGERCGARGACVAQADSKAMASTVSARGRCEITASPEDRGAAAAVRQFTRPRRGSFTCWRARLLCPGIAMAGRSGQMGWIACRRASAHCAIARRRRRPGCRLRASAMCRVLPSSGFKNGPPGPITNATACASITWPVVCVGHHAIRITRKIGVWPEIPLDSIVLQPWECLKCRSNQQAAT